MRGSNRTSSFYLIRQAALRFYDDVAYLDEYDAMPLHLTLLDA